MQTYLLDFDKTVADDGATILMFPSGARVTRPAPKVPVIDFTGGKLRLDGHIMPFAAVQRRLEEYGRACS